MLIPLPPNYQIKPKKKKKMLSSYGIVSNKLSLRNLSPSYFSISIQHYQSCNKQVLFYLSKKQTCSLLILL